MARQVWTLALASRGGALALRLHLWCWDEACGWVSRGAGAGHGRGESIKGENFHP